MSEIQTQEDSQSTALVTIQQESALDVFKSAEKLQDVLDQVRQLATEGFTADPDTAEGRALIKAQAYKVTRTKTAIEAAGKALADELKALPKLIDANRKTASEYLAALAEEIRKPVTEYEAEQKRIKAEKAAAEAAIAARKAAIQDAIDSITRAPLDLIGKPSTAIRARLEELEAYPPTAEDFDDRVAEAQERWTASTAQLLQMAEQAEALEATERDRIEREAAARAQEEERQRAERAAAQAAQAAEQRIIDARLAAARQEDERKAAEERAARAEAENKRLQEEAAQREAQAAQQAADAERKRIADEQEAQRSADAKRAADIEHGKAIRNNAVNCLVTHVGLTITQAREVVKAIAKGQIDNVAISY